MKNKILIILMFVMSVLLIIFCIGMIITKIVVGVQYGNVPVSEWPGWVFWILR